MLKINHIVILRDLGVKTIHGFVGKQIVLLFHFNNLDRF
jgi:hypothetical protein